MIFDEQVLIQIFDQKYVTNVQNLVRKQNNIPKEVVLNDVYYISHESLIRKIRVEYLNGKIVNFENT